jgi:hypothetical protein
MGPGLRNRRHGPQATKVMIIDDEIWVILTDFLPHHFIDYKPIQLIYLFYLPLVEWLTHWGRAYQSVAVNFVAHVHR